MALSATELRIGNLVFAYSKECIIDAVDFSVFQMYERKKEEHPYTPVPLTEEWLLKFGFKNAGIWEDYMPYHAKHGVLLFFNEGRTEYELSDYLSGYGEMRSGKYHLTTFKWIKYVHQLQNLYFALTGEELTAN
jgi:hypothetical protein